MHKDSDALAVGFGCLRIAWGVVLGVFVLRGAQNEHLSERTLASFATKGGHLGDSAGSLLEVLGVLWGFHQGLLRLQFESSIT